MLTRKPTPYIRFRMMGERQIIFSASPIDINFLAAAPVTSIEVTLAWQAKLLRLPSTESGSSFDIILDIWTLLGFAIFNHFETKIPSKQFDVPFTLV